MPHGSEGVEYYIEFDGEDKDTPCGYIKVWTVPPEGWRGGSLPAQCPALENNPLTLFHTEVPPDYLRACCSQVAWADLPERWQRAFGEPERG